MKRIHNFYFLALIFLCVQCNSPKKDMQCCKKENDSLRKVFDTEFLNLLHAWYPASIDSVDGGFLCDFSYDWKPDGAQQKMVVAEARHVWTCSKAFMKLKDSTYLKLAKHGYECLKNQMWDKKYGGFYMLLDKQGNILKDSYTDEKRAYGNTFAIYALAAYFEASKDTSALILANETFLWLEKHSHDAKNKGYFDLMTRNGDLWNKSNYQSKTGDAPRAMYKDYNSSIHLLEAFTDLYKVSKDSLVKVRLQEMFELVRDKFVYKDGYLTLHFTQDWKPISYRDSTEKARKEFSYYDHVSFGHDVETAFLMLEAADALGIPKDAKTITVAKSLVDHTIKTAWDSVYGGIYYEGYYLKNQSKITIINKEKCWWAEAEMLQALLCMSKLFPDEPQYRELFIKQWNYCKKYLIDPKHGGWYFVGTDYRPEEVKNPKASYWKVNYHDGRALMNCSERICQ